MDQSYLHYSFMRGMQEYTDPLLTREVQASQDEARVALALLYPPSGDLIVALERVMSSTVMLFSSSGLTTNGIELMVVCYIFHTKAAALFQGVLFLVLA